MVGVKEARYWEPIGDGRVRCLLCPHRCILRPGQRGICRVRENVDGKLVTLNYGLVSSVAVDPIEKKPLFHFLPGTDILSLSTVGCNMRCPWCQNWEISQAGPEELSPYLRVLSPEDVLRLARRYNSRGVAWTYNEPTIWYEFALDTSRLLSENGIYSAFITNGFIEEEPLRELGRYLRAMNIDVKGFDERRYVRYTLGRLESVRRTAEVAKKELGIHVELTYLIVPGFNDDLGEIRRFARWVAGELGPGTPVHFSRFFPHYRYTHHGPTDPELLLKAKEVSREEGLRFVYLGNLWDPRHESTYCPRCGAELIRRVGYSVQIENLDLERGVCKVCGERIEGVWRLD